MRSNDPVLLYRAVDCIEAALLRHTLEVHGVPATVTGGLSTFLFGILSADAFEVDVWVAEELAEHGHEVIVDYQRRIREHAHSV